MRTLRPFALALAAGAALLAGASLAQEREPPPVNNPPTEKELLPLIDRAIPEVIGEDNTQLLRMLVQPKTGPSVYETFDPRKVAEFFGQRRMTPSKDCFLTQLPDGSPDTSDCTYRRGSPEGKGAFWELRFDKSKMIGEIAFVSRPPEQIVDPGSIKETMLSDREAAGMAAELAMLLGVPEEEVLPMDLWDVQSIGMAFASSDQLPGAAQAKAFVVEKLVRFPRALDAGVGFPIPVLGSSFQASMDDGGIQRAHLREWTPFEIHPAVDPSSAYPRSQLRERMLEALLDERLAQTPAKMSAVIAYVKARDLGMGCPGEDEGAPAAALERLPAALQEHAYVPSLVLFVSMGPDDPKEEEQEMLASTTPFLMEFPLVASAERECGGK